MSAMVAFFVGLSVGLAVAALIGAWLLRKVGELLTLRW